MTEGLVRVSAEINLPGEVWNWLVELSRTGFYQNPADAMSFLLTAAMKNDRRLSELHRSADWATAEERAAGQAKRIG